MKKKTKKIILILIITSSLVTTAIIIPLVLNSSSTSVQSSSTIQKQNQAEVNKISVADLPLPNDKTNLPSDYIKPVNGVLPATNIKYEFITWDQDDNNGTINWEVKLTKGTISKNLSGTISNFKTTTKQNQAEVNKISVADLPLPNDKSNLPSEYVKPVNGVLPATNIKYEFTTWNQDDDNGTINWEVKLTKGTISKNLSGTISDFKTIIQKQNQAEVNKISAADLPLPNDKTNLPSEYDKPVNDVLPISNIGYEFTTWNQDNDNGTINWEVKLTKGTISKNLSGTISNFKTTIQKQNQAEINKISAADLPLPNDKSNLPSEYDKPVNGVLPATNIKYEFTTWNQDDDNGTINWEVKLTKGTISKNLSGTISSFKTIIQKQNQTEINKINAANLPLPNDKSNLPSEYVKPVNGVLPISNIGYEFTTWNQDDDSGTINWEVKLTKGTISKNLSGTISSFKIDQNLPQIKQDSKEKIKEQFLKIKIHIDKEIAKKELNELTIYKEKGLEIIDALKTRAKILEEQDKIINKIIDLEKVYKKQLLIDFEAKMKHSDNNYQDKILEQGFTIPQDIGEIPAGAFSYSTFHKDFKLPTSIKKINKYAFLETTFKSNPILPENVKIKEKSFNSAKIPLDFSIPDSAEIEKGAFNNIKIGPFHRWIDSNGKQLKSKTPKPGYVLKKPSENKIKFILEREFHKQSLPDDFVIPNSVTEILGAAFSDTTLNSKFKLPNQLKKIHWSAFRSAIIPEGFTLEHCKRLEEIEVESFRYVKLPKSFKLPKSIKKIYLRAFEESKINADFNLPPQVEISSGAFKSAQLPFGFKIPNVAKIEKGAFAEVKLPLWGLWHKRKGDGEDNLWFAHKEFDKSEKKGAYVKEAPKKWNYISKFQFFGIESFPDGFKIPEGITEIGEGAFKKAKLPSDFVLPDSVKTIRVEAFASTKIGANFKLSSKVTLYDKAFAKAKLPNGFKIPIDATIQGDPFEDSRLPIWSRWYNPIAKKWFTNGLLSYKLKNPDSSLEDVVIKGAIIKKENIDDIKSVLFEEFKQIKLPQDFRLPINIKTISHKSFFGSTLPAGFVIHNGVTEIKEWAFAGAKLPFGFKVPSSVTKIASNAFFGAKINDVLFQISPKP